MQEVDHRIQDALHSQTQKERGLTWEKSAPWWTSHSCSSFNIKFANLDEVHVESSTGSTMQIIGGLMMAASMQISLFGTDSESGNSDSDPLDSIALEEFVGQL